MKWNESGSMGTLVREIAADFKLQAFKLGLLTLIDYFQVANVTC